MGKNASKDPPKGCTYTSDPLAPSNLNIPNRELMLMHPSFSYETIRGAQVVLKTAQLHTNFG